MRVINLVTLLLAYALPNSAITFSIEYGLQPLKGESTLETRTYAVDSSSGGKFYDVVFDKGTRKILGDLHSVLVSAPLQKKVDEEWSYIIYGSWFKTTKKHWWRKNEYETYMIRITGNVLMKYPRMDPDFYSRWKDIHAAKWAIQRTAYQSFAPPVPDITKGPIEVRKIRFMRVETDRFPYRKSEHSTDTGGSTK